jgi:hypothetical protein
MWDLRTTHESKINYTIGNAVQFLRSRRTIGIGQARIERTPEMGRRDFHIGNRQQVNCSGHQNLCHHPLLAFYRTFLRNCHNRFLLRATPLLCT